MTGYAVDYQGAGRQAAPARKDYSVPLHVDCSIEYELPDCAKPPQGVKIEPLLMIHPSHFRRLESMRRVPFVNNLPRAAETAPVTAARAPRCARAGSRRCCRAAPAAPDTPAMPALPADHAAEYRLILDELLAHETAPRDPYRYAECAPEYGEYAAYKASLGKQRRTVAAAVKPHPYLPEPTAHGYVDCDITRGTAATYERLARRKTLQQLPIYM